MENDPIVIVIWCIKMKHVVMLRVCARVRVFLQCSLLSFLILLFIAPCAGNVRGGPVAAAISPLRGVRPSPVGFLALPARVALDGRGDA